MSQCCGQMFEASGGTFAHRAGDLPAALFGHGNPMKALETNRSTSSWQAFGQAVPRPRVILVVSADAVGTRSRTG